MKTSQRLLFICLILLFTAYSSHAQLSGLNKLKSLKSGGSNASIDPDLTEHKFPPSVGFQSLLTDVRLDPQKSILSFGALQFYFLPSKETNGKEISYSTSSDNPNKIPIKANLIAQSSGEIVETFYFELNSLQRIVSQGIVFTNGRLKEEIEVAPGKYRLDFYLGKMLFQKFPFEVFKTSVDDPYSPAEALYTIGGDWEKYALLQINQDGKGGEYTLRFEPIINYKGIHTQSNSQYLTPFGEAEMKCVLKKNGSIIGSVSLEENTDPNDIFGEKYIPAYFEHEFNTEKLLRSQGSMRFYKVPKVSAGDDLWVQMKQLTDGDYTIEMAVRKMADRADFTTKYGFSVNGGRIVPATPANRQVNKDPTTYYETGRDYVLIESN